MFTYRENDTGVCITSCDTAATSADIPEEIDGKPVTEIGDAAFMNCAYLTAIDVPSHVTKIGESAFSSLSHAVPGLSAGGADRTGQGRV